MQSLKIIFTLTIFSYLAMNTNRSIINNQDYILSAEATLIATAFGQQFFELISLSSFDENTTGSLTVESESELTDSGSFGLESGESVEDDIDDYHGKTMFFSTDRMDGFSATVSVTYVDTSLPNVNITSKSYLKRVTIVISNPNYLESPVSLEQLYAYFPS